MDRQVEVIWEIWGKVFYYAFQNFKGHMNVLLTYLSSLYVIAYSLQLEYGTQLYILMTYWC